MRNVSIGLAKFTNITAWEPAVGDIITRSIPLPFMSWWGIISSVELHKGIIKIIRAANPQVLFLLGQTEQEKRTTQIDISKIKGAKGYAIQQIKGNESIWYIN